MTVLTPGGSRWPARLAYAAAFIFVAASSTTNIAYGWGKGDNLATSIVWAAVAGAVAIVLALSWPALIRSIDAKRWSAVALTLVALLLSGAYSITCALGSAAGSRMNATVSETATTETRKIAQAAYDNAKAELDGLSVAKRAPEFPIQIEGVKAELGKIPAARSVAELEALMRRACPSGAALKGQVRTNCPRYDVELARAWERSRLTAKVAELTKDAERAEQRHLERRDRAQAAMDKASAELARIQPARVVNSDAKALTRYLGALGLEVGPDRLNNLLVLLAVIMVEVGGGLSLAVALALQNESLEHKKGTQGTPQETQGTISVPYAVTLSAQPSQPSVFPSVPKRFTETVEAALVRLLREHGGHLVAGQRTLGRTLGVSATHINRILAKLSAAGVISLDATRRGSVVRLVVAGTA